MLKNYSRTSHVFCNLIKNHHLNQNNVNRTFISSCNLRPNLIFTHFPFNSLKTSIHTTSIKQDKIFVDYENNYIYNFLSKIETDLNLIEVNRKVTTEKKFSKLLNQNWRSSKASQIVQAFISVQEYCCTNNINLADDRFDKLVDGLMDHCEKLTDSELLSLLQCLSKYPPCETIISHNFHDIWSCLDDICCWKMNEWKTEKLFLFADAWFCLNLGKVSDFVYEILNKLPKKAKNLNKNDLVRLFFLINICRKYRVDFDYEYKLEQLIDQMTTEELAVIALGFFKSQSKVKLKFILETMIDRITANSKTVHEIALTAMLKIIRFSHPYNLIDKVALMLDKLVDEVDRLSNLSCLHIALVNTPLQLKHEASLQKITEKISREMTDPSKVRLKDIERLLLANTMFNFDSDIYEIALKELHVPRRLEEIVKYPKCLPYALNYLSLRNLYSYQLMDQILNHERIIELYGKSPKNLPRELFALDCSIDVECPGYKGNRLEPNMRYRAAKWATDFTPTYDQFTKLKTVDKFFLDVIDHVKLVIKNDSFIHIDHVLPHFSRADIILCKNRATNKFIAPFGFENYALGDIQRPVVDDNFEWYALTIVSWNLTSKINHLPLGLVLMKERQLQKIGFNPIRIPWNEFTILTSDEKTKYIVNKLKI